MLQTVEATLLPSGVVTFAEPLPLEHPIPVLITLLKRVPESPSAFLPIVEPATTPAAEQPTEPLQKTSELGRKLLAIRQHAIAQGMKLESVDAILEEVRQGRAEASDNEDLR